MKYTIHGFYGLYEYDQLCIYQMWFFASFISMIFFFDKVNIQLRLWVLEGFIYWLLAESLKTICVRNSTLHPCLQSLLELIDITLLSGTAQGSHGSGFYSYIESSKLPSIFFCWKPMLAKLLSQWSKDHGAIRGPRFYSSDFFGPIDLKLLTNSAVLCM